MGILPVYLLRLRQVHVPQGLQGQLPPLSRRQVRVHPQALLHLGPDAHGGVHGAHGLLEHHADVLSLDAAQGIAAAGQQVPPVQQNLAPEGRLLRPQQTGDHHGRDGFAAAGFTHQAHDLAVAHRQVDAPHRLVVRLVKLHVQIPDLQHTVTSPIAFAAGPRPAG